MNITGNTTVPSGTVDGASVNVIDQTSLPHEFATMRLANISVGSGEMRPV
jgi:hypothetical protein